MRPIFGFALAILLAFVSPCWAEGQKVYRIGALVVEDQFAPAIEGFKQRMAELGYVEGTNIIYELHNAKGNQDILKKLAERLVEQKPDLIATTSTSATIPVAKLTNGTNLPVVFLSAGDPLRFVRSYSSSGNNLTGISSAALDLIGKHIELLKNLTPRLRRFILLVNPAGTNYAQYLKVTRVAAKRLGLELREVEIRANNAEEVKQRLFLIKRKLGDGLLIPPDAQFNSVTESITQQVIKEKLPNVGSSVELVGRGLLASYSANYHGLGEQGAVLVDKILKGAKPADLPIEQPYKLKLAFNLKTAKAIGLNIPRGLLLQADEVIK
jgi:putative ABC transport system substrate-binding protein